MANEKNKAHELASAGDEDTSELEALTEVLAVGREVDLESESDAATHSFENLDKKRRSESFAALETELDERDARVGRLEYELEQLRSRSSGLETELKARETATANVASELAEARQALGAARERLQRRDGKLARLEARLRDQEKEAAEAARALAARSKALAEAEEARADLEQRVREAEHRITAIAADLESEKQAHAQARAAAETEAGLRRELEQQHAESRSMLETLRQYIEGRKAQWEQQDVLLRTKDTLLEEQHRRIRRYASEIDEQQKRLHAAESDAAGLRERQAALGDENARLASELDGLRAGNDTLHALVRQRERLAGALSAQRHELQGLREQLERTESYADGLRRQLAERVAEAAASEAARREVAHALLSARTRIDELASGLEAERDARAELERLRAQDQQRFDDELNKLRLDLTSAEDTIAENQTLNEQLASDLLETSSFRVALESQLSQADESYQKQIRDLTREVKKLKQQVEDSQRKIVSKDAAIGVLLAELAAKPVPPPAGDAEPVVHRLAERKADPSEERAPEKDRERTARLLIGAMDGQEVRFPLFKNKLTIGRTAHNDIQLKAQYISRRHAVVVCDNDSTRIVDWGSKNGIYVNGQRVSEKILKHGDKLTVGTAEFRYEELPKR